MKKIVLGCAAVLLSMGLLAGCNNDTDSIVTISVDNTATVVVGESLELPYTVEPEKAKVEVLNDHEEYVTASAKDGVLTLEGVSAGSATVTLVGTYKKYTEANTNISVKVVTEGEVEQEPGPGTPEKTDPVIGTVTEGDYWLGFTMGDVDYYFDGSLSGYYGSVTSDGWAAATVTVEAVTEGGYTLSFTDSEGSTKYLYAYVANGYVDLGIQDDPFTWQYDTAFETFVVELKDQWNFIGTYGSYVSLSMNDYGYLTGDTETSNAQYPAKLYTPETYVAPESITLSGNNEVAAYELITLTAAIEPANADPSLVWSWESNESNGEVTVYDSGMVLGVTEGTVTVTATSVIEPTVSGSIDITVSEGSEPTAYKLGSEDTTNYCYYWFNGKTTTSSGSTFLAASTDWNDAVDVYITKVDGGEGNTCALSFYDENSAVKYITCTSNATSITLGDNPCTWIWNAGDGNGYFSAAATAANGRFIGESANGDFRAYAASNLSGYPHVQPFTTKPEDPEKPTIDATLEEVSSITSGNQYYLGAAVDEGDYQFITGTVTSYKLPTVLNDLDSAALVTVTGSEQGGWTLTIGEKYIYAYVYNSDTLELGTSSDDTVPSSGVNVFSFDTTSHAFYTSATGAVTSSYEYSYLEYYSGNVTLYGSSGSFSNAAHLYQVVDGD